MLRPFFRHSCQSIILAVFFITGSFSTAISQDSSFKPDHVVRVGVSEMPPFVMKDHDGNWTGISFELWDQVAKSLDMQYGLHEFSNDELYGALSQEKVDVALFMEQTRSHEYLIEFSRTFLHSDLAIASLAHDQTTVEKVLEGLSSPDTLKIIAILFGLVLLVATIFWWLEKHKNPELYNQDHGRGNFMNGILWAMLLVTAQEPDVFKNTSFAGRIVAMLLLIVGITVSASYIALITSALTVNQLSEQSYSKEDLPYVQIGVLHGSRAAEYLDDHYIKYTDFESIPQAITALEGSEIKVVLADGAELDYFIKTNGNGQVVVSTARIETEYYHLAFPEDSTLRKYINPGITKFVDTAEWREVLQRFLGFNRSIDPS